jgi:hypothetical protein
MTPLPKKVLDYRRVAPPVRLPRYLGLRAPTRRRPNWVFLTIMLANSIFAIFVMVMSMD